MAGAGNRKVPERKKRCEDRPGKGRLRITALAVCLLLFVGGCFLFARRYQGKTQVLCFSETEPAFDQPDEAFARSERVRNPFSDLCVPTLVTRIAYTYFIVDCYHDQIIYSDSLDRPLQEWYVMTDQICRGHTLAGDGQVYLADDTENNRILVFENKSGTYVHTQTLADIGIRPHYIVYREEDGCFYAWSSMTGEMYVLRREQDSTRVYLSEIRTVPSLQGCYVRSFTIMGDEIYFVSGNSSVIRADLSSFRILEEYPVPDAIAGMIQITWIDGYFYITVSTDKAGSQDAATIIRTDDLAKLAYADYEDVYAAFIGGGTPYYISALDGRYYLTEHRLPGHSLWSFDSENGEITDVVAVY